MRGERRRPICSRCIRLWAAVDSPHGFQLALPGPQIQFQCAVACRLVAKAFRSIRDAADIGALTALPADELSARADW
jgi:hypothetical protein